MLRIETLRKINVMRGFLALGDVVSEWIGAVLLRILYEYRYYTMRIGVVEGRVGCQDAYSI